MIIQKVELGMGNASASPTYKLAFRIGDEVEVTREEVGYSGARYEAIIVEPLKPTTPNPKTQNMKRGFWVQYKHLLSDDSESVPKREFIRKRSLLRPAPPIATKDQRRSFRVNDIVDAFYLAGWWTGVVVSIVDDDDDDEDYRFWVAFKDPDEELEFSQDDLRFHLDWIGGKWVGPVAPHEKLPLHLRPSSAALNHTIKGTGSSKKKLEIDTRTDVIRPPKKLRSRKHFVEALDKQEFARPLVSGKAFTRKPRSLGSVDNRLSHAMKESRNCLATEVNRSSGDCNKLVVEEGGDRELNKEDIKNVVDVGILAPCLHSLKHTVDKDGKLNDSEFQIVEGSRERSTVDLSDHRSPTVTQGVEKQVLESSLHDSVNEQNASSSKTNGINTSAGASAAAGQPCPGTTTQQPNEMPNAELNSVTTPEPRLVLLPFKKNSALWREFESLEIFTKIPQNPHFSPLAQYEEKKREEVALLKMTKYAFFVERIPKLTVAELNSSALISDMLDSIKDLEEYGFDLMAIKRHLNDLLLNNEKQIHLRNKLEEEDSRIRKCCLEKAIAKNEINKIAMKIKDLEKELMSAKTTIETMDHHIKISSSVKGAICDDIRHVELDFEGTVASVKQIFS